MALGDSADGVLQGVGVAYTWVKIVILVVVGVALGASGVSLHAREDPAEVRHELTGVDCEPRRACASGDKSCEAGYDCAISGEFGTLQRVYPAEPAVGGQVTLFRGPDGQYSLEPDFVAGWAPFALYAACVVCLLLAVLLFVLRRSEWFRRYQGVSMFSG